MHELGHLHTPAISRLDLFADVQGLEPDAALMSGVVCPAVYRGTHAAGSSIQTFQYGKGEIVARIYNKTAEIATSGKGWLRTVWEGCEGYEPGEDVWRVEFQLRRDYLKETCGRHPDDVLAELGALWLAALSWCELRVPHGTNASRWQVHPAWAVLAELAPESVPHPRCRVTNYAEGFESVVPQVAGLLISACSSVGMWKLESGIEELGDCVKEYIDGKGVPFAQLVRERTHKRLAGG